MTSSANKIKGIAALGICALIWGTAFIAQSIGGQYAQPLTLNCARSVLASVFLTAVCYALDRLAGRKYTFLGTVDPEQKRKLLRGGLLCGLALAAACFMQQLGIMYTTVGKSGFLTALYIVLVPLLGAFLLHRKVLGFQWLGVLVAVVGMYFICINESFSVNKGDIYTLGCALCFALQILAIEHYIPYVGGVRLSLLQFIVCAVFNGILMFIFEQPAWEQIEKSLLPIMYLGFLSNGVAYTLQIIGQKYVSSVLASMLMSLESVFALLSGWLLLGQVMSVREIGGCVLVFIAIMLAQIPPQRN